MPNNGDISFDFKIVWKIRRIGDRHVDNLLLGGGHDCRIGLLRKQTFALSKNIGKSEK